MKKPWYKSRTIWLAVTQSVLGVILAFMSQYPEVGQLVLIKSAIDMFLRMQTADPLIQ